MNTPPTLPSGWFPDPHRRHDYRWFNGTAWTADVSDDGRRLVDPLGAAPTSRAAQVPTGNGLATGAITCGLLAILFAWMPIAFVVGIVLGVLGVVLGIKGRHRARQLNAGGGVATAGIVSGGAALLLSIAGIALTVSVVNEVRAFMSPGAVQSAIGSCEIGPGSIEIDGTVTNLSDTSREYTVYGVVLRPNGIPDLVDQIGPVAPGASKQFLLHRSTAREEVGPCEARIVVHGPSPYGLEMERIDD